MEKVNVSDIIFITPVVTVASHKSALVCNRLFGQPCTFFLISNSLIKLLGHINRLHTTIIVACLCMGLAYLPTLTHSSIVSFNNTIIIFVNNL